MGTPETVFDLKGRPLMKNAFPGVGTRIVVNGNVFRIGYVKHGECFRFSADFVEQFSEQATNSKSVATQRPTLKSVS